MARAYEPAEATPDLKVEDAREELSQAKRAADQATAGSADAVAAAKSELERLAGDVTSLRSELKEKDAQLSVAAELESKAKAQLADIEFACRARRELCSRVCTPKVQQGREELSSQAVGNALYGLQCMGDSTEVRELLAALTPKVQQCSEELSPQAVGNALYGLQRMGDSSEVRQLVAALTTKSMRAPASGSEVAPGMSTSTSTSTLTPSGYRTLRS